MEKDSVLKDSFIAILMLQAFIYEIANCPLLTLIETDEEESEYVREYIVKFIKRNTDKLFPAVCEGYLTGVEGKPVYDDSWKTKSPYEWTNHIPKATEKFWNECYERGLAVKTHYPTSEDLNYYSVVEVLKPFRKEFGIERDWRDLNVEGGKQC